MQLQRESFIIGNQEFHASKIPAFKANNLLLRIQKIILPVMGELANGKSIADMDVNAAFKVISENLDESVMTDIVMPMFALSIVSCKPVEGKQFKLDSEENFNKAFPTADELADMYTLIFDVLKFNFGAFFTTLAERFGAQAAGDQSKTN